MKYIIYGLLMLCAYGANFGLLPNILPFWLSIDLVLICLLCIAQKTKDYTAPVISIIIGLIIDISIFNVLGAFTLFYFCATFFYAKFCEKAKLDSFFIICFVAFVMFFAKDCYIMIFRILQGNSVNFFENLLYFTLLSSLINSIITFPIYIGIYQLHSLRSLKLRRQLDLLRDYEEKNRG